MKYILLTLMLFSYCFMHSFLISIKFTKTLELIFGKYFAYYRLFYNIFSVITLLPIIYYKSILDAFNLSIFFNNLPAFVIRYSIMGSSLGAIFYTLFFEYDYMFFLGIKQIKNSKNKSSDKNIKIKKSGLLGISRHPMYLFAIIFLWAKTFKMSDIVLNTALTIYILIGIRLEEKKLILQFGDEYIAYQKEVPMLL